MNKQAVLAGAGALAFGVLAFVAMMVSNAPGGDYKASDITAYLARGHRPAVFISAYLMLIAVAGILLLLARLRILIAGEGRASIFWGFGVAATGAWIVGYTLTISPVLALAYSGGHLKTLSPTLVYSLAEAGWAIAYGAGGLLLGCALLTFVLGPVAVPSWARWFTAVAAVAALAALAWFPFFLVYIWAIVIGLRTLVADRTGEPVRTPQLA